MHRYIISSSPSEPINKFAPAACPRDKVGPSISTGGHCSRDNASYLAVRIHCAAQEAVSERDVRLIRFQNEYEVSLSN